jgi:hypothetical protein
MNIAEIAEANAQRDAEGDWAAMGIGIMKLLERQAALEWIVTYMGSDHRLIRIHDEVLLWVCCRNGEGEPRLTEDDWEFLLAKIRQ